MSVDFTFDSMQDFCEENLVQQTDSSHQLIKARERLTDLRNKISDNERLEELLDEVLKQSRPISEFKHGGRT